MRRRFWALFILLFFFWIAISGSLNSQSVIIGLIISFVSVSFWHPLIKRLPELPLFNKIILIFHIILLLIGYIIYANIQVAKKLLFSTSTLDPILFVMNTDINGKWGRALLAAFITITPGTITVDVEPDTGRFIVHALTEETAVDLLRWRIIGKVKELES